MASASADLPDDVATLQALLIAARAQSAAHLLMIEKLKAQLAKLRRMQFGQSSEKLDAAILQRELALEDERPAARSDHARDHAAQPGGTASGTGHAVRRSWQRVMLPALLQTHLRHLRWRLAQQKRRPPFVRGLTR